MGDYVRASARQVEIMKAAVGRWLAGGGTRAGLLGELAIGDPKALSRWSSTGRTSRRIPWRVVGRMYAAGAIDASEAGELADADPECPTPEEIATLASLVGA